MIIDVELQGRKRDVQFIGKAVGFDLDQASARQLSGLFEIGDGLIEAAGADVAVATVAV